MTIQRLGSGLRAAMLCAGTIVLSATGLLASEDANSGARQSFQKEWGWTVERAETLADAIPEDLYDWRPAEGVRSVSEVLMHIAGGNFMFADDLGLPRPDDLPAELDTVTDKASVMAILRQSFAYLEPGIESALADDLDRASPRFGSVGGVLLRALVHANEHVGQLIAYGRTNGVAPPWSR